MAIINRAVLILYHLFQPSSVNLGLIENDQI
jgi:hypothetical protein